MSNCSTLEVAEPSASESRYLSIRFRALRMLVEKLLHRLAASMGIVRNVCLTWAGSVALLILCKTIIGSVAAFDTYLTLKYAVSLHKLEQNPIGRWLMDLDNGPASNTAQVAAFITAKFLGTLLVLITIQGLAYWRLRIATTVAFSLAVGQVALAWYLLYGPA